ncbi:hypothetical protein [Sorangium sp. So ce1099]|uniref:hypothetical protein n=1 Tax=Sorangium sp. So ce1099 TaxID=3133331 RepID=UPI003F61A38D
MSSIQVRRLRFRLDPPELVFETSDHQQTPSSHSSTEQRRFLEARKSTSRSKSTTEKPNPMFFCELEGRYSSNIKEAWEYLLPAEAQPRTNLKTYSALLALAFKARYCQDHELNSNELKDMKGWAHLSPESRETTIRKIFSTKPSVLLERTHRTNSYLLRLPCVIEPDDEQLIQSWLWPATKPSQPDILTIHNIDKTHVSILMREEDVYAEATLLAAKAGPKHVLATLLGEESEAREPLKRYLEALARRIREQIDSNGNEMQYRLVVASHALSRNALNSRTSIFEQHGVGKYFRHVELQGSWSLDMLIIDDSIIIGLPSIASRTRTRQAVRITHPEFVNGARMWFEEYLWNPRARSQSGTPPAKKTDP